MPVVKGGGTGDEKKLFKGLLKRSRTFILFKALDKSILRVFGGGRNFIQTNLRTAKFLGGNAFCASWKLEN